MYLAKNLYELKSDLIYTYNNTKQLRTYLHMSVSIMFLIQIFYKTSLYFFEETDKIL